MADGDLAELLALLAPLTDEDYCQPYDSAWEINTHSRVTDLGGEQLHARIKTVYDRLTAQAPGAVRPAERKHYSRPDPAPTTHPAVSLPRDGRCPECREPVAAVEVSYPVAFEPDQGLLGPRRFELVEPAEPIGPRYVPCGHPYPSTAP